ncbi:MAG: AraC family transcriptional regulator [Lachnospiraceae bacterium]|jgi:AraC-like DNA-binding protein|nr:AraC family transcriptional regulator [Lachnospiraceae bacterium]MCI1727374.1 AraC family transcriptional regulator [Lachnospiraceae bacterium]
MEKLEIFDDYNWTKEKKVITKDKHHVTGLGNFSYWNYNSSTVPSPMHFHSDIMELHCMIKGIRLTQIEKNGEILKYITTGNQICIVYPYEMHSNGTQPQMPCEFYAFQVNLSDPGNMFGLNHEYSYALCRLLTGMKDHQLVMGESGLSMLRTAFNLFSDLNPDTIRIGVQYLTSFLFTLQYLTPLQKTEVMTVDSGIRDSIRYLNENLQANLRLEDLAQVSGYSLSRFKVKFKKEIGVTPAEFITLQKLDEAKKQLRETDKNITEIAYDLGFSSSNYFSSVFKKIEACTPQYYRKKVGIPDS